MANVKNLYARISATADGFDKVMDGVANKTQQVSKSVGKANSNMTKGFQSVAASAGSRFSSMGKSLQGVSQTTGEVGSKMTNSITKPAGIAAGAVGGLVAALGFKRLIGMDAAEAKLKGLGYQGKEVTKIQGQVETAIQGGMTTMAEGTDIAAGGLAAGVEQGKDLEKYIKLVGDAAVGSGRPVNEMAMIFARVQGSGKVMTEELNMVEEGMPGFSKAMADNLGVPLDEFKEKVTAGEVSSEDFMETMDTFAGKMSKEYAKSFEGMIANTKAFTGQIGEKLLSGAFEKSKKTLGEFLEWLSSEEVQNGALRLGQKIGTAFNIMISVVSGAVKWFAQLPAPVHKIAGGLALLAIAVGPVLQMFGKLTGIIGGMFSTFGTLLGFFAGLGPVGLTIMGVVAAIVALGTAFYVAYQKSETFRNFINGIGSMISGAIGWIKQFGQAISALFGGDQKEGTSILKRLGFNQEQVAAIQGIVTQIKGIFSILWSSLSTIFNSIKNGWNSVIGLFRGSTGLLTTAFNNMKVILGPIFQGIVNIVKNTFTQVMVVIKSVFQIMRGVMQVFGGLFKGDWRMVWAGIKNIFWGALNGIIALVKLMFMNMVYAAIAIARSWIAQMRIVLGLLKNVFVAIWNSIKFVTLYIWNGIKNAVITSAQTLRVRAIQIINALKWALTGIWNAIKFVAVAVWNGIKWAVVGVATAIKNTVVAIFNGLKFAITSIWNGIKWVTSTVWNGIKALIVSIAQHGIKGTVTRIFNALKATISVIWNAIKAVTSAVWNVIKNTVIRLATTLRNTALAVFRAFRSGLTAIWNTMKSVASSTWNWIKNKVIALARTLRSTTIAVFNALKNGVSAIWNAIKSATSAAWNWIKNKVIALARTLRSTVVNVFNAFKNTINNIWNAIKGFTSRTWNGIKNTVVNLATGLKNTVVSRFNTLKNAAKDIWGSIKSTSINMWQGIKDKITGFATGIKDGVTGTFSKMADVLKGTIGKIKGFVQDMVDKVKGGLNKLIDGVNWVGDKLGMGEIGHVKMHTGTSSSGSVTRNGKLNRDVMATVGDKGKGNGPGGFRHETVIPPRGKPFITPNRDTLMPAKKGTTILNGAQTHDMFSVGTHAFAKGTGVAGGKKPKKAKKGDNIFGDVLEGSKALGGKVLDGGKAVVDKTLSGVKKGKDWLGDKVKDVMDFIDKPEKLLEHVLKGFGVGFDLAENTIPADMMKGMFKKLKAATIDKFKSWFEESGEGEGGWVDISKGVNFPFSPNGRAPGYPFAGPHMGVDLNYVYDKLYSTHGGKATAIPDDGSGFGNHMSIKNGALEVIYGHMSKLAWKGTKDVNPGSYLGVSGNSGKSSGPHLHYELRKNGKPIDPMPFLKKQSKGGKNKKASAWSSDIKKAAKKMNVKLQGNDLKNIISLINAESSGNAGAVQSGVNDINSQQGNPAKGLLQYIPQTFKKYATKGHGNIKSGYDQLLAFFNNKSWRSQFNPNGGWSPSGAVRGYADGGIINAPELAWIAEGGFSESVISHDPKNRTRSKSIHDKTGKMLGVDNDTKLLEEIIDILEVGNQLQSQNNNSTRRLLDKENNVYLNRKKITEEVNRESANIFDGQLYNQGG